ncbi:MAG: hypothetical protein ACJZ1O_05675 [Candidatus Neomarinimicrobiota bacterium]
MAADFPIRGLPEPRALHLSSESGTVSAGSSFDVDVMFDASGMNSGEYYANIIVTSNDSSNAQVVVPVHLGVTGCAQYLGRVQIQLDFGEVFVNYEWTRELWRLDGI